MQIKSCFVIGPIGNELAPSGSPERLAWESALEIYERVIRAACDFLDIEAIRADQISVTGDINDQIFRHLFESDIVIADLSGANANVMYELGLRHSLDRLTIQVADVATPLPFDVKVARTIMIERTPLGLVEARKKLVRVIESGLQGKSEMVAATRIWTNLQSAREGDISVVLGEPADDEIAPEIEADAEGYLELVVSLDEYFTAVTESLQAVGQCMVELNADASQANAEISALPPDANPAVRLLAVQRFATTLDSRASELDLLTVEYEVRLKALDSRITPLLRILADAPGLRGHDSTGAFLGTISSLAVSARSAFDGFGGFANALKTLGAVSQVLRTPAKKITASIARLATTVTTIDDWDAATQRILEMSA